MADKERERWLAARIAARQGRRAPVIESCTLVPRVEGGFEVVVRGQGLRSGAVPPHLQVGSRPVRSIRGENGTILRGIVDAASAGDPVVVDLGPGGRASAVVGDAA